MESDAATVVPSPGAHQGTADPKEHAMRAVVARTTDTPGQVQVVDLPTPQPGPSDVAIRTVAAAVNPVDVFVAHRGFHGIMPLEHPDSTGLGWDVAGTIESVGSDVSATRPDLVVGARVAATHHGPDKAVGALAEVAVVPATAVAIVPDDLDLVEAATVPLNALTAQQAVDLLGTPSGTLLVTGAAGAVGGYATPLATRAGWTVVGLARESDRAFVEGSGARLVTTLDGLRVDAVLDAAVLPASLAAVGDGGRYVGLQPAFPVAAERGITTSAVAMVDDGEALTALLVETAAGRMPTRLAATYPLSEAAKAVDAVGAGGLRGRVVVTF